MKIILLEDVQKLGKSGDVVKVSPGYGRNFLLPKKLAMQATPKALKRLDQIREATVKRSTKEKDTLRQTAETLEGIELNFTRKADENGHLYGSVSNNDIATALKEKGYDIHKSMIGGELHLKNTGIKKIEIKLAAEISASLKVHIKAE